MSVQIELDDYKPLIHKQALICYHKIKNFSSFTIEDLVQEGYLCFYSVLDKYDATKAVFSTFLTTVLRNHFSKVVIQEYKLKVTRIPDMVKVVDNLECYEDERDVVTEIFPETLSDTAVKAVRTIIASDNTKGKLKKQIGEELGVSTREVEKIYGEIKRKIKRI